jgi:hypothetical protein
MNNSMHNISLSVPHSDLVSPFHKKCLKVLNMFKEECNNCVLGQNSSKSSYNLDKCLDFHKFNSFSSHFTPIGCQISSCVTLLPILKPTVLIHSTKSIPNI